MQAEREHRPLVSRLGLADGGYIPVHAGCAVLRRLYGRLWILCIARIRNARKGISILQLVLFDGLACFVPTIDVLVIGAVVHYMDDGRAVFIDGSTYTVEDVGGLRVGMGYVVGNLQPLFIWDFVGLSLMCTIRLDRLAVIRRLLDFAAAASDDCRRGDESNSDDSNLHSVDSSVPSTVVAPYPSLGLVNRIRADTSSGMRPAAALLIRTAERTGMDRRGSDRCTHFRCPGRRSRRRPACIGRLLS